MLKKHDTCFGVALDHNRVGTYLSVVTEDGNTEIAFCKGYFQSGVRCLCSILKESNEYKKPLALVESVIDY